MNRYCIALSFVVYSSAVSAQEQQQMNVTTIELIDNANGLTVPAELVEDPSDNFIEMTAEVWSNYKRSKHPFADHNHWNWKRKLEEVQNSDDLFKCYTIACQSKPQGLLLMLYGSRYKARLPIQKGELLIYVAYVESAPWNLVEYTKQRRYSGVGSTLLGAAQQFSDRIGFDGRIGLHSLPSTKSFYERECNMIKIQLQRRINNARKRRI